MSTEIIQSPCTLKCSLNLRVCISCGRSIEEIRSWSNSSDLEKSRILVLARQRLISGSSNIPTNSSRTTVEPP